MKIFAAIVLLLLTAIVTDAACGGRAARGARGTFGGSIASSRTVTKERALFRGAPRGCASAMQAPRAACSASMSAPPIRK